VGGFHADLPVGSVEETQSFHPFKCPATRESVYLYTAKRRQSIADDLAISIKTLAFRYASRYAIPAICSFIFGAVLRHTLTLHHL
jgi:hypothetical protein